MSRAPASPARIATFIAVPAALVAGVITAVVVANVSPDAAASSSTAQVTAAVPSVTVPVDPAAAPQCATLLAALPDQLSFGVAREVTGRADATAWGEPPVVLVCGVAPPSDLQPTSQLSQVNGVAWYVKTAVDTSFYGVPGENTLWTTVERSVSVAVVISGTREAAIAISPISRVIGKVVPKGA